jgi:hypothetical protein
MGTPGQGGLDAGPDVGKGGHHPAELEGAEFQEFAVGGACRGRGAVAPLDQRDLAEEPAVRHRTDEPARALDMNGAGHDHIEGLGCLALTQEHRAARCRNDPGQRRDSLHAARIEFGEDRDPSEDGGLSVHVPSEHNGPTRHHEGYDPPMPLERILAIGLIFISGGIGLRLVPGAFRVWRIYAGTGKRRQQDATGRSPAAPLGVRDRLAELSELGYHHIGETRVDLPVGERFAWIMAADDGDSYAILAGGMTGVALTGIYSAWGDGTWLATIHPMGTATDRVGLHVRIVTTTLAETVATQRAGMERLRSIHGAPRRIGSIPDMLALDADYRIRFGGSRLRPMTIRIVLPALLALGALLLAVVLLIVTFR